MGDQSLPNFMLRAFSVTLQTLMEKNGGFHESVFLKFNVICIDILLELVYKIVEKVLIL